MKVFKEKGKTKSYWMILITIRNPPYKDGKRVGRAYIQLNSILVS